MANSAFTHNPSITVPGSSTNTALVRWSGTGADTFLDSTIIVGATTMGLAADTDLLTFGSGTLAITGAVTGVTSLTASAAVTGATLVGTVTTATQNSITTMTALTSVATIGTGVWNGTAIITTYGGTGLASHTAGDMLYYASGTTLTRIAKGTADQVLTMNDGATAPQWEAASAGATLSGSANDTIVTVTGANAMIGEANLTFNGSHGGELKIDNSGGATITLDGTGQSLINLAINASSKWQYGMDTDGSSNQKSHAEDFGFYNQGTYGVVISGNGSNKFGIGTQAGIALSGAEIPDDGIQFPSTQAASSNAKNLDEYEEGLFTPALIADSTSVVATASVEVGFYTRIGHRVFYTIALTITSLGSVTTNQAARIKGLPFSASTATEYSEGAAVRNFSSMSLGTAGYGVYAGVGGSNSVVNLFLNNSTASTAALQVSNFTAAGHIILSGSYIAA